MVAALFTSTQCGISYRIIAQASRCLWSDAYNHYYTPESVEIERVLRAA
jgi:hypothetical protein